MIIENDIADGINFFHIDALSSSVALKINRDLQLTLMGSSLYRLLGKKIGRGYERAQSRHIFRDFVDAPAQISLTENEIQVRFYKRAHNPLLLAAGFADTDVTIPWLNNKRLRFIFECGAWCSAKQLTFVGPLKKYFRIKAAINATGYRQHRKRSN